MTRLLTPDEVDAQLLDLPGVHRDVAGSLVLALRAPSFAAAVRLIEQVADEAEQMDHHPDVDLRWRTAVFTFRTHRLQGAPPGGASAGLTQLDVELAHRTLAAARAAGAETLPPPQRVEVALDCADADAVRPFWAAGLAYVERSGTQGVELQDPAGRGPALWFQHMDPPRAGRGRFHLDVFVPDAQAQDRVAACLGAGGRLVDDTHAPSWWVLADPEGNELCVCTRQPGGATDRPGPPDRPGRPAR